MNFAIRVSNQMLQAIQTRNPDYYKIHGHYLYKRIRLYLASLQESSTKFLVILSFQIKGRVGFDHPF
jgi:hypothetical protein